MPELVKPPAITVTGHRPPRLGLSYSRGDQLRLEEFVLPHLQRLSPRGIISGGAQGFDQAIAAAARSLSIPYVIAIPFQGQEARWPVAARDYYRDLLADAAKVITVCKTFSKAAYLERDRWMVDRADLVLALFDGEASGGTFHTVQYASAKRVALENLWHLWLSFRSAV